MQIWGAPKIVKGVRLYPVTMEFIDEFYDCVQCILYQKNRIQDIQIIKMSYLDFLFSLVIQTREQQILDKFETLLRLTLRDQEFSFSFQDSKTLLKIGEVIFDGYEFEQIRTNILELNMIKVDESILDPEMEKALQDAEEFLSKRSGTPATIEERIITLHCLSNISYQEIKSYTIYQFNKTLERFAIIKNFDTYAALMAENGKAEEIEHWLSHIEEKAKYSDVTMTESEFKKLTSDGDVFKS